MTNATAKQDSHSPPGGHETSRSSKKRKFDAFLVTLDDALWPEVGVHLTQQLTHRQIDSIDELLSATRPGEAAIILWDARGAADHSEELARLAAHSPRFAVIVLDVPDSASRWAPDVERGQVVACVPMPVHAEHLASALGGAYDEVSARVALLGDGTSAAPQAADRAAGSRAGEASGGVQIAVFDNDLADAGESRVGEASRMPSSPPERRPAARLPLVAAGALALVLIAAAAYILLRRPDAVPSLPSAGAGHPAVPTEPGSPAHSRPAPEAGAEAKQTAEGTQAAEGTHSAEGTQGGAAAQRPEEATPEAASEEKVDALVAAAQDAMRDRHFIEPAEGSALALYRNALLLAPDNGEAQQGLKRLAEVLVGRVQSALDEKQFDAALQALETVRSIDANDPRLPALDERIAKMRDELGPAEIEAAINAQNFERAAQLIDQAAHNKSISDAKLAQLREDLRRRHADSDVSRILGLLDARLAQGQLIEPANDSALSYFTQARKSKATASDLQPRGRDLVRRLLMEARKAIDERRLGDAERISGALRSLGTSASTVAALQRDIATLRAQQAQKQSDESRLVDLVKSRLGQGYGGRPDNDSAYYYLGQLRATNPQNPALPDLARAVQSQILAQAGNAIDAAQLAQADSLLQLAATLGSSPDAESLAQRLRAAKSFLSGGVQEVAEASLTRLRTLDIEYPPGALQKNIQGTVELAYVVGIKGAVSDIKVLNANPSGIFESAATKALSRMRYKPFLDGRGKPVAVSTKMLVIFRPST